VLVNDDLDETLEELKSILSAERRRKGRMTGRIQSIIESFQIGTKI
jgi:guanylate kinase